MTENNLNIDIQIKNAVEAFKAGENVNGLVNEINKSGMLERWIVEFEGISPGDWCLYITTISEFFYDGEDPRDCYGENFFEVFNSYTQKVDWFSDRAKYIVEDCYSAIEFKEVDGIVISIEVSVLGPGVISCKNFKISHCQENIVNDYTEKAVLFDTLGFVKNTEAQMIRHFDKFFEKYRIVSQ